MTGVKKTECRNLSRSQLTEKTEASLKFALRSRTRRTDCFSSRKRGDQGLTPRLPRVDRTYAFLESQKNKETNKRRPKGRSVHRARLLYKVQEGADIRKEFRGRPQRPKPMDACLRPPPLSTSAATRQVARMNNSDKNIQHTRESGNLKTRIAVLTRSQASKIRIKRKHGSIP